MTGLVRLRRVSLTVGDLAAAERFYVEGLGFRPAAQAPTEPAVSALFASPSPQARSALLELGRGELELVQFDPPGQVYPTPRTAADPWFQHFAIVVQDMARAYAGLREQGQMSEISIGGPQLLPPNTGSVTAFKFRDPDGHPLELSAFPPGVGAPWWHKPSPDTVLGIDHSAIAVADVDASLAFYVERLGMSVASRGVNRGVEQDRLDGLTCDGVEIVVLQPQAADSAHMELLHYPPASRPPGAGEIGTTDIAATRLTFQVDDLDALLDRLSDEPSTLVSPGAVRLETGETMAMVRDPDGHLLVLSDR